MNARTMTSVELREHILDSTELLLGRYGYRKMTMDDVAREAGIGKGTTYLHFPSKEELVLSTVDRITDELVIKLTAIAHSKSPVIDRLQQMIVLRVMLRLDKVQHYSEALNELLAAVRTNLLKRREIYFARESEIFAEVLRDGQNSGELKFEESPEDIAKTILLTTNALLPFNLSHRELGKRADIETKAQKISKLLLYGLHSPAKS